MNEPYDYEAIFMPDADTVRVAIGEDIIAEESFERIWHGFLQMHRILCLTKNALLLEASREALEKIYDDLLGQGFIDLEHFEPED